MGLEEAWNKAMAREKAGDKVADRVKKKAAASTSKSKAKEASKAKVPDKDKKPESKAQPSPTSDASYLDKYRTSETKEAMFAVPEMVFPAKEEKKKTGLSLYEDNKADDDLISEEAGAFEPVAPPDETGAEEAPSLDIAPDSAYAEPDITTLPNVAWGGTNQTQRSKKEYEPEAMDKWKSSLDAYNAELNKPDDFDISAKRNALLDKYTQGMEKSERIQFINAIAENLGKMVAGGVGLATGGDVAKNFSYKALDPEMARKSAESQYEVGSKGLDTESADHAAKTKMALDKSRAGADIWGKYASDTATDVNDTNANQYKSPMQVAKERAEFDLEKEKIASAERRNAIGSAAAIGAATVGAKVGIKDEKNEKSGIVEEQPFQDTTKLRENIGKAVGTAQSAILQRGDKVRSGTTLTAVDAAKKDPKNTQKLNFAVKATLDELGGIVSNLNRQGRKEDVEALNQVLGYINTLWEKGRITPETIDFNSYGMAKLQNSYTDYMLEQWGTKKESSTGNSQSTSTEVTTKGGKPPAANPPKTTPSPTPAVGATPTTGALENYRKAKEIIARGPSDPNYAKAQAAIQAFKTKYPSAAK
jgi:hypothetical protein